MKFWNRQFGELEFEENHLVLFPAGLIGFDGYKRFLIVNDEETEPFRWLVSVEEDDLSFPLLDPALLIEQYADRLPGSESSTVFLVASLHEQTEHSTVNLRSPLVIDNDSREGRQVILDDDSLPLQYPLSAPPPQQQGKG
jgi:flagellar assembly factor FliW